jgi:hypothetical protein
MTDYFSIGPKFQFNAKEPWELSNSQLRLMASEGKDGAIERIRIVMSRRVDAFSGGGVPFDELAQEVTEVETICHLELLLREGFIQLVDDSPKLSFDRNIEWEVKVVEAKDK